MKASLVVAALLCCVVLSGEARAQTVWTYNDLQFNGCTGSDPTKICAVGSMSVDYSAQVYYNLEMYVTLVDVEEWPNNYDVQVYRAWNETSLWGVAEVSYSAAHEYRTEMQPHVTPNFRSDDGVYFRDYYNFAYFNDFPILWPAAGGAFGFAGPGPEVNINFSTVFLGLLNRLVIQGVKSGTPDHLHVFHNETVTRTDGNHCGEKEMHVDFSIVDASHGRVGRTAINEAPPPPWLKSSCDGKQPNLTVRCNDSIVNVGGNFRDTLGEGCPSPGGHCGFEFYNTWRWCSTYDGSVCKNLATMWYSIYYDIIKVDNEVEITRREKA